jgi:hypothetical protein
MACNCSPRVVVCRRPWTRLCVQLVEEKTKKATAGQAVQEATDNLQSVISAQQSMLPAIRRDIEGVEVSLRKALAQESELEVRAPV